AFHTLFYLTTGWLTVEGSEGIKALVVFRRIEGLSDGKILSEAAFAPAAPATRMDFIPQVNVLSNSTHARTPVEIGLALANPDPISAANGEIQLYITTTAKLIGTSRFTLGPHQQIAQLMSERFADLADPGAT